MKIIKKIPTLIFHFFNLILVILYLYPGSIIGCFLYKDCYKQPQITQVFFISSNHLYIFIIFTAFGIFAYNNTNKIKSLIIYLFSLSVFLELFHIIIPNRSFEWSDLFGNIMGVIFVFFIYKINNKYV